MGEFSELLYEIRTDKNKFNMLMKKMDPLVNKYTRMLYKDEKEDVRSELYLALWESVMNISLTGNDGQVVHYLSTAIRNRFLELYRKSCKHHDNEGSVEHEFFFELMTYTENEFDDFIVTEDIRHFLNDFSDAKKELFSLILLEHLTDTEIADRLSLSRQYINRMRKQLQPLLIQYFHILT